MPLSSLSEDELRAECRRSIDSLERWLRDLIDAVLTKRFGENYIDTAKHPGGQNVFNADVRRHISGRISAEPGRYPRQLDALQLDHAIAIICRTDNWNEFFEDAVRPAFDATAEYTRKLLSRIEEPRNRLAHANPISVRMAERVICYSHDTIDAIKPYLLTMNDNEFDIAKILRISDSFGNTAHGGVLNTGKILYPGDRFWVEVEADPNYDPVDYVVKHTAVPAGKGCMPKVGNRAEIELTEKDICETFMVSFTVAMDRDWHRMASFDDSASARYKVLPGPRPS